jgi:PAS domain S-box-containing protein
MNEKIIADNHGNHILCSQWIEMLDELNIGAFTVDLNRRISSINYKALALMGLKSTDVVGKDCRETFIGVPCMVSCLLRDSEDEATEEPAVEILDEDDKKFYLHRMATPIYDSNQEFKGCLTILQDHSPIADLIDRIHYEERSMKMILDSLDVGIFTVNRGGHITFFNKAAEKLSGYDRRQVLGKSCSTLFEDDEPHDFFLLKGSIANGIPRNSRFGKIRTADDETLSVRANYMALKNEKGINVGGLATFHDLTLVRQLKQAMSDRYTFHDMIGKSPEMQKIFETVTVISGTDTTILIEGATGTGKDLLAKVIHSSSKRSYHPFIKVNCAALPDNLLESEMFGYVKGAFTGADRDKPGRFNEADKGTIFLDEIGDLPLSLQAKLLRVLEDKEFYPLGGRHTKKVDVRIISATNRGLDKLVEKRLFREDLFYRLNVFRIELPALKNRWDDLPILIRHILRRLCASRDNRRVEITEQAMKVLLNFSYPGNVRELENILEHALIICQNDVIDIQHLPDYLRNNQAVHPEDTSLIPVMKKTPNEIELDKILRVLNQCKGNKTKAAKILGINRTTLWRKMKQYDI